MSLAQKWPSCPDDEVLAQLDFWIGEWNVYNSRNIKVGTNKISRILKSCAIQEEWTDSHNGKGISIFFKNPNTGKLKQLWLTEMAHNPGGTKEKDAIEVEFGKSIRFQGSYPKQGKQVLDRTTLTRLSYDKVKQTIEISYDEGKTWKITFIGIYKRKG
ncbi:MAG: hypothetical protein Roseis2KO_38820 [Roseivirga sp.]